MNTKLLMLILIFASVGCTYGYESYVRATMFTRERLVPTDAEIEVHFEGQPVARAFRQIAYLEATGKEDARTSDLVKLLKDKARALGADAVISVKKGSRARERGDIITDLIERGDADNYRYEAPVLSGLAVKYVD